MSSMEWQLPTEHYSQALEHEASLVCLLLIDRKLVRLVDLSPDDFVDIVLWKTVYQRLRLDCFASLESLLSGVEDHAARTIADAIRNHWNGFPRVFRWNFDWHVESIRKLADLRRRFIEALDFVMEYAA